MAESKSSCISHPRLRNKSPQNFTGNNEHVLPPYYSWGQASGQGWAGIWLWVSPRGFSPAVGRACGFSGGLTREPASRLTHLAVGRGSSSQALGPGASVLRWLVALGSLHRRAHQVVNDREWGANKTEATVFG